jgi:hypothetical protein
MNVAELIAELQKQDRNATVIVVVEDLEDDNEIRHVEMGDDGKVWLY